MRKRRDDVFRHSRDYLFQSIGGGANISKLKDLRITAGWTQTRLAEAAHTDQRVISHLETGTRSVNGISLEMAARIASALGVHAEELMDESEIKA